MNNIEITLRQLITETLNKDIEWELTESHNLIKATHIKHITNNKSLIVKVLYYLDDYKESRIFFVFYPSKNTMEMLDSHSIIDGENVLRLIILLFSRIIQYKKEFDYINKKFEDSKILKNIYCVGDRVKCINDLAALDTKHETGTVVKILQSLKNVTYYLVEFDRKFSSMLVSKSYTFEFGDVKGGKCWPMLSEDIEKLRPYWGKNSYFDDVKFLN